MLQRSRNEKKTYIKLTAATVLASTLPLELVEIKRNHSKPVALQKQVNHQVLKQLLLAKKVRLKNLQAQLHLKRLRHLLVSLLLQRQISHKRNQHLNQDKNKQSLVNKPHLRHLQLSKALQAQSNQSGYDPTTDRQLPRQASRTQQTLQG